MVTKLRILALACLAACSFNDKNFQDKACSSDVDCRVDQSCVQNVCVQKTSCAAATDCPSDFLYDCVNNACVAEGCSGNSDCTRAPGYACIDSLCQANFNVASATSTGDTQVQVTFDAPPDPTQATSLANYAINGLDLSGTPTLTGNTVTLTTSPQSAQAYTLIVSGVTRASDHAALRNNTVMFGGRASFDVTSASSVSSRAVLVVYDANPDAGAGVLANYSIPGLALSGTPMVIGNTVTLATAAQQMQSYTVTVSNVHRASDAEPLTVSTATFTGRTDFDVIGAASVNSTTMTVTFDAAPDSAAATTLANYNVPGLTLSGTPVLNGNTVTLTTTTQATQLYTVTVANVTRASDGQALVVTSANFLGTNPFDVASAAAVTSHSVTVTFDAPPNAAQATTLANYTIAGLTLSGTPTLSGNIVTLTTSAQSATTYTVTVNNVTRASDGLTLTNKTAMFTGRPPFDVASALATTTHTVTVTFDAAPNPTQATTLANYAISGLTLSGTPTLSGSTVTLTTSAQAAQSYTVTVNNVTRNSDAEPLTTKTATFTGRPPFDVSGAAAISSGAITVTFDAAPDPTSATTLANYSVPGLTLAGAPMLSGNTVTIATSPQAAMTYTVTVTNVTRASDAEPLTVNTANFMGRTPFNVIGAASIKASAITVTYDAAPNAAQAMNVANYTVSGLTLGTVTLSGNTVTITTSLQSATSYTVSVVGVTRASDGEPLSNNMATFVGRAPFDVTSALSVNTTTVTVTFDAAPNASQATTLANYAIPGLTLSGTPVLSGNTVTLTTSAQSATTFTVTVSNVTRNSDAEPLTVNSASFTGRAPFDVSGAVAANSGTVNVTYDAAPNPAQAVTIANYTITGLTVTGASLSGNVVTLSTTAQANQTYTVVVSGVTRASDGEALTVASASFKGIPTFNVTSAASASNTSMTVTFDAPPNAAAATTLANYSVPGLTLSGTPTLSGNVVTITTSTQTVTTYTVTVSNVARASDGEPLTTNSASFTGRTGFNVSSAASVNTTTMSVTFDAPPNAAQATLVGNYSVPGLTLTGTPVLSGNTVTITTTAQAGQTYTVTVSNVTRASDGTMLTINTASFTHTTFNVSSAAAVNSHTITVTYDAAPTASQATTLANYAITCGGGCTLSVSGTVTLSGNTVTITTAPQTGGKVYTVTVSNVTRATDGVALTTKTANFTGIPTFNVSGAASANSGQMTVTYDAAPNATQATTLANYTVTCGGSCTLGLYGTPVLSGNTVTINTNVQSSATTYTVTVANVTRASDGETLTTNSKTFSGTSEQTPTVTNVVVTATSPDNGTTFYNTGTATVVITGTDFTGTNCLTGVNLDDRDGNGNLVNTSPTACSVDSGTQITATFPSGIRTNGTLGWNVLVTNAAGLTNTTSAVKVIVLAGLLVSEVQTGVSGSGNNTREFIEIYNPTGAMIDLSTLGVNFHIKNGTGGDTNLAITYLNPPSHHQIPSHGWLLISSKQSTTDSWVSHEDGTYDATLGELVGNGGVYLSLSTTAQTKVLDKMGWGNPGNQWFEGTAAVANLTSGNPTNSAQRKPLTASGGAGLDTDQNFSDFNPPSSTISPMGTADPPMP